MARKYGYDVISLEQFFELSDKRSNKHFVLRHDVDNIGESTRKMFDVEQKIGVKSTYYFRKSTIDMKLIDEMITNGFDVGFHYETITNYAVKNHIKNKNEVNISMLQETLHDEIIDFENVIGHKIHSICGHGTPVNDLLKLSNNALVEGVDISNYGVKFEAYQRTIYDNIDCHIMDCSVIKNGGFAYRDTPISAIQKGLNNIILLAHPEHWWFSPYSQVKKMGAIVLGKGDFQESNRTFCRVKC